MTDVASTTHAETFTMSVIAPGRADSVTWKQMCSSSQSAVAHSAAAGRDNGRSLPGTANGSLQRPRRWAGTPRLMTVSRANFASTSR